MPASIIGTAAPASPVTARLCDCLKQLPAVPNSSYAQILHVFCRQLRQDCFVNSILAESGLVLLKTKAPQPTVNVQVSDP
jgi:hypothetical protein